MRAIIRRADARGLEPMEASRANLKRHESLAA
jgi:hypothetical protein